MSSSGQVCLLPRPFAWLGATLGDPTSPAPCGAGHLFANVMHIAQSTPSGRN